MRITNNYCIASSCCVCHLHAAFITTVKFHVLLGSISYRPFAFLSPNTRVGWFQLPIATDKTIWIGFRRREINSSTPPSSDFFSFLSLFEHAVWFIQPSQMATSVKPQSSSPILVNTFNCLCGLCACACMHFNQCIHDNYDRHYHCHGHRRLKGKRKSLWGNSLLRPTKKCKHDPFCSACGEIAATELLWCNCLGDSGGISTSTKWC